LRSGRRHFERPASDRREAVQPAESELLDRPDWIDRVADPIAPSLSREADPTDHLIPVEVLVELERLRPALDIAPAVRRFVRAVWVGGAPRLTHRPDLPGLSDVIWVDCLHTDTPGLVLAGQPDAAAALVERGRQLLQDGTGLFSHGYSVDTEEANGVHGAADRAGPCTDCSRRRDPPPQTHR
jgi:hypothetical protein